MKEKELYRVWCENATADPDLAAELAEIKDDEEAINDRFYRDLEFGTGGLRGVIGAGTNRMNIYTVKRATQGFADYLNQLLDEKPSHDGLARARVIGKEKAKRLPRHHVLVYRRDLMRKRLY